MATIDTALRTLARLLFFSCVATFAAYGVVNLHAHRGGSASPEGDRQVAHTLLGETRYITHDEARQIRFVGASPVLCVPLAVAGGLALYAARRRGRSRPARAA